MKLCFVGVISVSLIYLSSRNQFEYDINLNTIGSIASGINMKLNESYCYRSFHQTNIFIANYMMNSRIESDCFKFPKIHFVIIFINNLTTIHSIKFEAKKKDELFT